MLVENCRNLIVGKMFLITKKSLRRITFEFVALHVCFYFVSGFKLTYHDSGNKIQFSFFTMQFFPTSLENMIPKHDIKKQKEFFSLMEQQKLFCCYHQKRFQYQPVMFYQNSFVAPAYTLKLKEIDRSYLKKLHAFFISKTFIRNARLKLAKN